jgi:hypothetical protein
MCGNSGISGHESTDGVGRELPAGSGASLTRAAGAADFGGRPRFFGPAAVDVVAVAVDVVAVAGAAAGHDVFPVNRLFFLGSSS